MGARRLGRIVIVAGVVLAVAGPGWAAMAVPPHPAGSVAAAHRGPTVRLSEAEQIVIRRQAPLTRAADLIRNAVAAGDRDGGYAGIGLGAHLVIVWWKGKLPARMAAAIGRARRIARVEIRPAAHSEAELLAASRRLWAAEGLPHGGPLIGIRMPFNGSGLTAAVAQRSARAISAASLPRVGVPVQVIRQTPTTWQDTRCSDSSPFWGGGAIYNATVGGIGNSCGGTSDQYSCTAGFAVTYGGNQYLTTAGHCGEVGDVFRTPAGRTIGTVAYKDQNQDLELIRTPAGGQVWDGEPNSSDFAKPVYGWGWSFKGESLCFSGTHSGPVCGGTVDDMWPMLCGKNSRGVAECFNNLISMANISSQDGDSGSPVFQLDGTLSKDLAVGSLTGIKTVHDESGTKTWVLFQQFGTATKDWPGLNAVTGNGDLFPPSVTVLANNTPTCPGNQQYFSTTDGSGVPIDWTYANGSNQCVQVSYSPTYTSASCTFYFYVPNAHATANVVFHVGYTVNGNPHTFNYTLNEAPISGLTQLFTRSDIFSVAFGDNNGQSGTQIGWGSNVADSLRQNC